MCSDLWFEQMWSTMLGRAKWQGLPGSRIVRLGPRMMVEQEVDDVSPLSFSFSFSQGPYPVEHCHPC